MKRLHISQIICRFSCLFDLRAKMSGYKLSIGNAIGDWADIEGMESVGGLEGKSVSEDIFGDDGFKRFDFGLGLKAGVEFNKKYQAALSYDFGLIDVQKDLGMKNRNLMISFGYMF